MTDCPECRPSKLTVHGEKKLRAELDRLRTEVREAYFAGFMAARAMEGGTPKHHTAIAAYGGSKYCASGKRDG